MLKFVDPKIEDHDLIQGYFSKFGENSCQHSFITLFSLYEKYGSKYCIQDDFLYVYRSHLLKDGYRTYLFPFGDGDVHKAVQNIIDDAKENNSKVCFNTITESKADFLKKEFPGLFTFEEVRDYAEYIHLTDNMAYLPGKKFRHKRRAQIVRRDYEGRIKEEYLRKEHIDEVLAFEKKWLEASMETHDEIALCREYRQIQLQLKYFDELKITGVIVKIDGEIRGFSFGCPISDECVDEVVQKGDRSVRYLAQMLEQDFALMCAKGYKYVNIEEDVGIEGLRENKLSYKPDILLAKYIATQN